MDYLYHATFKTNLESILSQGLKKCTKKNKNFDYSKSGVIYLSDEEWICKHMLNTYNRFGNGKIKDSNEIVLLKIDAKGLKSDKLLNDENLIHIKSIYKHCFEYHGNISKKYIEVVD